MTDDVLVDLSLLPEVLLEKWQIHWQTYQAAIEQQNVHMPRQSAFFDTVVKVWSTSDFIAQSCIQHIDLLHDLFASGDILRDYAADEFAQRLTRHLQSVGDITQLDSALRYFRRREMVRIAWRDIAGWADLDRTLFELTALADACIEKSLNRLMLWQCEQLGYPMDTMGGQQDLYVIALGKLGGGELNFSSDIDIMFAYPGDGYMSGPEKDLTTEEFFLRLAQQLIKTLNTTTVDGFVFRVDMRLRPFGNSGPLIMTFAGLHSYYQEQGRDWERYALVKARVVNANLPGVDQLLKNLQNFVYRHYLDYSAINALREVQKIMQREAQSKDLQNNIKRGPGGIHEIEFSTQVLQLIRGGREKSLQERNMLKLLTMLSEQKHLPDHMLAALRTAYIFFRHTEHRLQQWNDKQTQLLPSDEIARERLAYAMEFSDGESFFKQLEKHRVRVSKYFSQVFEAPKSQAVLGDLISRQAQLQLVWLGSVDDVWADVILQDFGFVEVAEIIEQLMLLRDKQEYQQLRRKEKEYVDILVPLFLSEVVVFADPVAALHKLLLIVSNIMKKANYTRLLLEHANAREQLLKLTNASAWLSQQLADYPILLEDLTDSRTLYTLLDQPTLEAQLRQSLIGIPLEDQQEQMNALRRFKHTHVLRVAAAELMSLLPLMKVSDYLTFTAMAILREVQTMATQEMVALHGQPTDKDGKAIAIDFCIVAYGKLGGIELSYTSDVDLVFLRGEINVNAQTNGDESISNQVFYMRIAQRIIHILSASTVEGILYKVDTRLRPSGDSGLLVSSIEAFEDYQQNQAWTWEHQALVRAQAISGSDTLRERFAAIRHQVLAKSRVASELREQVIAMRDRMREALPKVAEGMFDVKQGLGGITDIEFLVQFGVLRWAEQYPSLLVYPDNIRILEAFAAENILSRTQTDSLCDAYRCYRGLVHRAHLQEMATEMAYERLENFPAIVSEHWEQILNKS